LRDLKLQSVNNIRLNKFISETGFASRRKADDLIKSGKVLINGQIAKVGETINPTQDKVTIDSQELVIKSSVYYAVYKPKGIISSAKDESDRKTVTDLVDTTVRIYPIGRLDKDSEGLMILTNDGELTQELTHPKHEHKKEYEVIVKAQKKKDQIDEKVIVNSFLSGLHIEEKIMKADHVSIKALGQKSWKITAILHTGYNRQIRKMCDKIGLEVIKLVRIRIAKLSLKDLQLLPGQYKQISKIDII